jgi:hypothetical protein
MDNRLDAFLAQPTLDFGEWPTATTLALVELGLPARIVHGYPGRTVRLTLMLLPDLEANVLPMRMKLLPSPEQPH